MPPAQNPAGDSHALPPGTRIGRYELIGVLGEGGFGITYHARDRELHREVAIKEYLPAGFSTRQTGGGVLPRSTQASDTFLWGRERFVEEARTLARLEGAAGIVNVYDIVTANGTAYMVMAFVRGETLATRLARDGRLSQAAIDRLLPPLLDGLEHVHRAGFLHRDIKPANILVDASGLPTLIDFGASRAALQGRTQTLTAVYTPGYAAFEQFTSAPQGPWTDIYALGATLYHCTTGILPPSAADRMREDTLVPAIEAVRGHYAPGLLSAIDAALRLREAERPQSIHQWRHLLAGAPPRPAVAAPTGRTAERTAATAGGGRRRRGPLWLTAGAIGLALAGGAAFLVDPLGWRASPELPGGPPAGSTRQRDAGIKPKADEVMPPKTLADQPGGAESQPVAEKPAGPPQAAGKPPPAAGTVPGAIPVTRWRLSTSMTARAPHATGLRRFVDEVGAAASGKLEIQLFWAGAIVPSRQVADAVENATIEVGETPVSFLIGTQQVQGAQPTYDVHMIPILAASFADARKLWNIHKPVLERQLAARGLLLLYVVPSPPLGLFARKDVASVADLRDMKVYATGMLTRFVELVRARPSLLASGEIYPAMERGVIDAALMTASLGINLQMHKVASRFHDLRLAFPLNVVIVNRAAFDRLDESIQRHVRLVAEKSEARGWTEVEETEAAAFRELSAAGIKLNRTSPRLTTEFQDIGRRLTDEWLAKTGADGRRIIDAYRQR